MSRKVNMSAPGVQTPSAPDSHRFPRTSKLLKHALFDQVYQRGQRHFSGLMTVFFLRREPSSKAPEGVSSFEFQVSSECGTAPLKPTAGLNGAPVRAGAQAVVGPRIGLTVGRVLGNSVVRNRIRRRMREAVRLNLHRLSGPVDVVINPKKIVLTAEFAPIVEEVQKAFDSIVKRLESGTDSALPGPLQPRRHARRKAAAKLGKGS